MEKLEELLTKIGDVPEGLERELLVSWLKEQDTLIGKQQHSISPTSEQYAALGERRAHVEEALKIIRREIRERKAQEEAAKKQLESGLVPKGTAAAAEQIKESAEETEKELVEEIETKPTKEQEEEEYVALYGPRLCSMAEDFRNNTWKPADVETKKRLYRERFMKAQTGDADEIYQLGFITDIQLIKLAAEKGSEAAKWHIAKHKFAYEESRKYMDMFVEAGALFALYEKGCMLLEGRGIYKKDYRQAAECFEKYIEKHLQLDIKQDVEAYWYYHLASFYAEQKSSNKTKFSNPEYVEEQLKRLPKEMEIRTRVENWERDMRVGEVISRFTAELLMAKHRYEEAIGIYLEEDLLEDVISLFFKVEDAAKRQKLSEILLSKLNSDKTESYSRGVIANWFGWRYENGKEVICDKTKAFEYYWKAEKLGNETGKKNRIKLLMAADKSNELWSEVFLEAIAKNGYLDAYKYLGDKYAKGGCNIASYQKAQEYYMYAQNGSMKDESKKLYEEMTNLVNMAMVYNEAVKLLDTDRYEYAFEELKKLADKGLPEACMKVAALSEDKNSYMGLKLKYVLLKNNKDIVENYRKAADAGLRDAQRKMAEIYERGLLGVFANSEMQKEWEKKLQGK